LQNDNSKADENTSESSKNKEYCLETAESNQMLDIFNFSNLTVSNEIVKILTQQLVTVQRNYRNFDQHLNSLKEVIDKYIINLKSLK
jgi:hypothetical protein